MAYIQLLDKAVSKTERQEHKNDRSTKILWWKLKIPSLDERIFSNKGTCYYLSMVHSIVSLMLEQTYLCLIEHFLCFIYTTDYKIQMCIHERIAKDACGKLYSARVFLVGKNGVGKTSLKRRLLGQKREDVTSTQSTDGIEIEKCNINIKDGTWSPCHSKKLFVLIKKLIKLNHSFING